MAGVDGGTSAALPARVRFAGSSFTLLKFRFLGGATYRSATGERYLRVGAVAQIESEVRAAKARLRDGFAVAPVVACGALDAGRAFFVEESLGETTFGDAFTTRTEHDGRVDDGVFDAYLEVMARYLAVQCTTAALSPDVPGDLAAMVRREEVLHDDPADEVVLAAYRKAEDAVTACLWCPSQGDLNPFNTLPAGVIDFELAASGPLGYDVLTAVHFGRFWPGPQVAYVLNAAQVRRYEDRVDGVLKQHGMASAAGLLDTFLFLKAFWATSRDTYHALNPAVDASLWHWRSALRTRCAELYLQGRPIRTDEFADLSIDEGTGVD